MISLIHQINKYVNLRSNNRHTDLDYGASLVFGVPCQILVVGLCKHLQKRRYRDLQMDLYVGFIDQHWTPKSRDSNTQELPRRRGS